jgi:DNA polymerase III alpha subunit
VKTTLNDRVLWFDGTSEVKPELVPELLLMGASPAQVVVSELSEDIKTFNALSDDVIASSKERNEQIDTTWNIPDAYKKIDLQSYVERKIERLDPEYKQRAHEELDEIENRGLTTVFKTLIFIIDQLKERNQIWGVGRGSSCASLVLHLIGVHEVDPVKFGIPASEFFHD